MRKDTILFTLVIFTLILSLVSISQLQQTTFAQQQQNISNTQIRITENGVIFHDKVTNLDLDTSKPLGPQFAQGLEYNKSHKPPSEYKKMNDNFSDALDKGISACNSRFATISANLTFFCNTIVSIMAVMCQQGIAKQDILACSSPYIRQYLKSHNIDNAEAFAKYSIEKVVRINIQANK